MLRFCSENKKLIPGDVAEEIELCIGKQTYDADHKSPEFHSPSLTPPVPFGTAARDADTPM